MLKKLLFIFITLVAVVTLSAFDIRSFRHQNRTFAKISTNNLLAISWQNAFCQTHKNKRECRNLKPKDYINTHFTLHGLWPQPRSRVNCKAPSKIKLDKDLYSELIKYMPAAKNGLFKHEWRKHGSCYGKSASEYVKDSLSLLKQINNSEVQKLFSKNIGKRLTIQEIRYAFDKSFGKGSGRKVKMNCKNGLITELWINLKGEITPKSDLSELLKGAKRFHGGCKKGKVDEFGY